MRFRTHLVSSALAGLALYPRRPLHAAALTLAGTLIDLDHLLLYMVQTGDWSVSGALRYDRYRHRLIVPGDNRPRYGPLRSPLHKPWLVLPPLWYAAARRPALRPLAIGLSLHLLLDYLEWPWYAAAHRRANGRCDRCGTDGRRLVVERMDIEGRAQYRALCKRCQGRASTAQTRNAA